MGHTGPDHSTNGSRSSSTSSESVGHHSAMSTDRSSSSLRRSPDRSQQRAHQVRDKTCALLFFGLAKQFRSIVLPSIQESILSRNAECDIFAHTYKIKETDNPRNGESHVVLHTEEVRGLTPNLTMDTDGSFGRARNVSYYRTFFPTKKEFFWSYPTSMDNMIKQWHSIERVWNLMEASGVSYQQVGLFRLDVQYATHIHIWDGSAVVPQFASVPMNDRMFYGTHRNAKVWATRRFSQVEDFVYRTRAGAEFGLHSEHFMEYLMRDVKPDRRPICFNRVRATGDISCDCAASWLCGLLGALRAAPLTRWFECPRSPTQK